ncbi:uncharacterized protein [Primulina eburnea]|uniref:uncharacterized protein n=1 Tax=Primulina eburnea TaxID=1245227 RepID=UPI003C6C8A6A
MTMANSIPLFLGFLFWFYSSLAFVPATYSSNETDFLALLAFKSTILPDPLGPLNSWNQTSNFCTWEGIICSPHYHERVIEINLVSRGLKGTISPYVGNLSFLTRISLQNNNFHGVIPQEIGRLGQLEFVEFSGNSFTGDLPSNLSQCSNLVYLNMTDNSFSGMIPPELGSLHKLEVFNLTNNKFFGIIPPSIGNLTSLTHLSLSSCGLTGQIPESFGQLQSLILLQLTDNGFSGSIPLGLFNISTIQLFEAATNQLEGTIPENIGTTLTSLRGILLAQNKLSGVFPVSLLNSTTFERIGLFSNKLTGPIPKDLGRLSRLTVVAIWSNYFVGDISFISSLTNCTNLSVVLIGNNLFTGFLPISIANLSSKISKIDLSHNKIRGNISSDIRKLYNLARLNLSSNYLEGSIPLGIGNLGKLIDLDLGGNRFTSEIPSSIGNLTLLNHMFLQENHLFGSVPKSLINCTYLLSLNLSHNNLNGSIPQEIMSLSSLSVFLDLSHNSLTGSIPFEVGSLTKLGTLYLSDNRLSGLIPASLGSCTSLEELCLEGNSFEGEIPSELSDLEGLQILDISRNNLSGDIPSFLSELHLEKLNLSFNNFQGQVPISGVFRNKNLVSLGGNKELCGGILELELPACPSLKPSMEHLLTQPKFLIPILVLGIICATLLICWIRLVFRRRNTSNNSFSSFLSFAENYATRLSYSDLVKATGGFNEDNVVGVGRFGSVYRGILHGSTQLIAVKVFNLSVKGASKSLLSECKALRNVRHRNLLKILSICDSIDSQGYTFKALVYEFKANGSLEKWIHHNKEDGDAESKKLDLIQRLEIAIDVAHAVEYLHYGTDSVIVHGDLKPSNILLDHDMAALVGDFGLAKIVSSILPTCESSSSIGIMGTVGYIPPEYGWSWQVTTQGDIYSYGILLLEMFTGRRPTSDSFKGNLNLHDFVCTALPDQVMEIVDPIVLEGHEQNLIKMDKCLTCILSIGLACSKELPGDRMPINVVVQELQRVKDCYEAGESTGFEFYYSNNGRLVTLHGRTSSKTMANSTALLLGFLFCFFSSVTFTPATFSSNETDLLALLAFKSSIVLNPLGSLNSWNQTSNFCVWEGIVCSRRYKNRVAEINLMRRGLVGTLSPYIGNLTFLTRISIQNNGFQGGIPQEIGLLGRLEFVEFSSNSFTGELPRNLSQCSNLVYLNMSDNRFSGLIPSELGSMHKVEVFILTDNKFLGIVPPSIGNLTSLTHLSLSSCGLTGQIPESFGRLQSLIILQLTGNSFTGGIPLGLFNISTIQLFEAANNQLEGTIPETIGITLTSLTGVLLAQNKLSGVFPVSLLNSTALERIGLFSNKLTGPIPKDLGRLSRLTVVAIWSNNFVGDISFISSLTNCTNLRVLLIDNNLFTGFLPISIANLSGQITQLGISHNKIRGNISSDIRNLHSLARLNFSSNYLEGSIPLGIGNLGKLIYLDLGGNRFTNEIPSMFGNLTSLNHMFFQENHLFGTVPKSLINCTKLLSLDLSHNNLYGSIPKEITSLSSLSVFLDLSHNSFTGSIPLEVGSLTKLGNLDLSDNTLSGLIPASLGSCTSLEELYLQGNSFEGEIPSELSDLKGLQFLDLSRNNLSGKIPSFLSRLQLEKLNLSFNDLQGQVPISGVFRNKNLVSLGGNKELCGGILELELPACPSLKPSVEHLLTQPKFLIPMLVFGIICITLLICWIRLTFRKRNTRKNSFSSFLSFPENQVMRLSYSDLVKATGGFNKDNVVGVGRFGSVYRGILHGSAQLIAVKVFNLSVKGAFKSLLSECKALRNARHRNLLKILSICDSIDSQGSAFKALVYEFKANGSLEKWIHHNREDGDSESTKLDLIQRLEIAIDVAHAVEYLHCGTDSVIVHGDLKPSNILLDHDMVALVGDFGLAKIVSSILPTGESSSSVRIMGTFGYIPPEYGSSWQVTMQGDVYSYGILLLEMFTGRRPTSDSFKGHLNLHDFVSSALPDQVMEIVDPIVLEGHEQNLIKMEKCLTSILSIGLACSEELPGDRMPMNDVVQALQMVKDYHEAGGFTGFQF